MSSIGSFSILLACSVLAVAPALAREKRASDKFERTSATQTEKPADGTTPSEILVKFEEDVSSKQIEMINRRLGATVTQTMLGGRLLLVTTPYPSVISDLIAAYSATEGVEYAEPNQSVSIPVAPEEKASSKPAGGSRSYGGGLPPPNKDGSAPLISLPAPN